MKSLSVCEYMYTTHTFSLMKSFAMIVSY